MKKVLGIVIALAMVASCLAGFSVSAEEPTLSDDFVIEGTKLVKYVGSDMNVVIPDGITEIGGGAFNFCSQIVSVEIPSSVEIIGNGAFYSCSSLETVDVPSSVTIIDEYAFAYCDLLETVNIAEGVMIIESSAFYSCYALEFVNIPNSVTTIGSGAFMYCRSLVSVDIPSSVIFIDNGIFSYCYSLEEINVSLDNANYSSVGGVLFNKNQTELVRYPIKKAGSTYVIPSSVTTIEYDAFACCYSLETMDIPEGVETIGFSAFEDCWLLKSVSIPSSVEIIGAHTFNGCTSLETVNIAEGVALIADGAFEECTSLKYVYIPASVKEIQNEWVPPFDKTTTLIVNKDSYAHQWAVRYEQPYTLLFISSIDSMQDVFNLLKLIVSGVEPSAEQIAVADFVKDGELTAADALAAMKIVMNK